MIEVTVKGGAKFSKTANYLRRLARIDFNKLLAPYAEKGLQALQEATPVRTGKTASSWGYTIEESHGEITLTWTNSNVNEGTPVALVIQYGHGMPNGGYVSGIDYINPVLKPIFDEISYGVWKEVTKVT